MQSIIILTVYHLKWINGRVCVWCVCESRVWWVLGTVHGVLGPREQFNQGPEGVLLVHVDQQQSRDLTHTLTVAHFLLAQEVRLAGREGGREGGRWEGRREGRMRERGIREEEMEKRWGGGGE